MLEILAGIIGGLAVVNIVLLRAAFRTVNTIHITGEFGNDNNK